MEPVKEGKDYSFPKEEEEILKLWEKLDAFKEQLRRTEGLPEYVFYDGPPFATGLPHYGHILAGTIKDIVTRYYTATGRHCVRRFGWDCHGLPVEHEIDTTLGIKTRDDVLRMGIGAYNEKCRSIVMTYSAEWEKTITRIGRWIDFKDDYKTLDPPFMESVWWVFKQLFDKGLVYRGFKVMPYSTACATALSNFEAQQNYKEVTDPAVMVSFPLLDDPHAASLVAWTTTPWTLPSNLALCVHPELEYVTVRDPGTRATYIVARALLGALPAPKAAGAAAGEAGRADGGGADAGVCATGGKDKEKDKGAKKDKGGPAAAKAPPSAWVELASCKGSSLANRRYAPLFPYFSALAAPAGSPSGTGAFRVLADGYVTADSGTGVVHCAPAYGEDDYRVCVAGAIVAAPGGPGPAMPNPVDDDGCFTAEVPEFKGQHVKAADKGVIAAVKALGRLVHAGVLVHNYPFCWRSETPIIYRAVSCWFVRVEAVKERLLEHNTRTKWVPAFVQEKRFHNWLESARDWCVSRSRFWGTPMPLWASDDGTETVCIGSVEELRARTGDPSAGADLHRHHLDHLTIPSATPGNAPLKRVDFVFDCWFESGSMPYAQQHYPFENTARFEANFPADFIAEGLDQTRGWFYTLLVLSTMLFDKPPFRNLICNGLVLAEDGKKMSKKLKNYPPPEDVIHEFGADALRLYLINSPVVRAEPLRFRKEGVFNVVKGLLLPWYNAYRFLVQCAPPGFDPRAVDVGNATNVLDRWLAAATSSLVSYVRIEMAAYRLYTVVPRLVSFIEGLTNVYVRYNRGRLKGKAGPADAALAQATLHGTLSTLCVAMAPFTPFFAEGMFQNLRRAGLPSGTPPESVHWRRFPEPAEPVGGAAAATRLEAAVGRMQAVIELARSIRERHNRPLKAPLRSLVIVHPDGALLRELEGELLAYVAEEANVVRVITCDVPGEYSTVRVEPDWGVLGPRLGKDMGRVASGVKGLDAAAVARVAAGESISVGGHVLAASDLKIVRTFCPPGGRPASELDSASDGDLLVVLDLLPDDELVVVGAAREVASRVQKLRKKAGLAPTDGGDVYVTLESTEPTDSALRRALVPGSEGAAYLRDALGRPPLPGPPPPGAVLWAVEDESSPPGFRAAVARPVPVPGPGLLSACGGDAALAEKAMVYLGSRDGGALRAECEAGGGVEVCLAGWPPVRLAPGKQFWFGAAEAAGQPGT